MVSFHQCSTSGLLVYNRVHPHDYPQVIPSSKLTVRACPDSGWFPPKIGDFQDLQWLGQRNPAPPTGWLEPPPKKMGCLPPINGRRISLAHPQVLSYQRGQDGAPQ